MTVTPCMSCMSCMSISRRAAACLLLAALGLGLATPPAVAQTVGDPELYGKSLKYAQHVVAQYGAYDNPPELDRVNRIGYELAQQSEYRKVPFTFALIDMPVPNAFTLPGGQIFITRGMLDLGLDDDMLASVVGHEIAHVTLEHFRRMQRKATLMTVLSNVLVAGVVIAADKGRRPAVEAPYDPRVGYEAQGGNLIQGAAAASLIVSELLLRGYSRDHEDEADEEGQRLAAGAGYDPEGAQKVWKLMSTRAPQAREYGYWQTHPFAQERERAAMARKGTWKVQARTSPDDFRRRTQATLSGYMDRHKPSPEETTFLKEASLATWPAGKTSEGLRLEKLHALRDAELAKPILSRDYGKLERAYRRERDLVKSQDGESALLATVESELRDFAIKRKELYPRAVEVLGGGVYETSFLVSFLSNFPDASQAPEVALALGDAYSRLGQQADAVGQYLEALAAAPAAAEGKRAHAGLRILTPNLKELAALQQLTEQKKDAELARLAGERLATLVDTYDEVGNGAEYLRRYPEGPYAARVIERLNVLAENLYGEVVLYQGVGDAVKALDRINKILTHAPLSPAAAKLRDRAVIETRAS